MNDHHHDYLTRTGAPGAPNAYGDCVTCGEPPPAICAVCERPTPTTVPIHDRCLTTEREILDAITALVRAWPEPIREILTSAPFELVTTRGADDAERLPFGLDAVTDDWWRHAQGINTTPGALTVLQEWRTAWVDAGAGDDTVDVLAYLRSRLVWAATWPEKSGLDAYRDEVRTVLARLRHINGDTTEPVEGARCLTCDHTLARTRTIGILDDVATCTRCGLTYDLDAIGRTIRARISTTPHQAPDALVTEPEARRIFADVGHSTIRSWIKRGHLRPAGTRRGAATYRVADITALTSRDTHQRSVASA